jgi:TetR/AcrR family transcriptional regulator, tetracycline repressor protein
MSPRKSQISREDIFSCALTLVDENGIEAVTMRNIAQKLGVKPMSLYNHIHNKEDLWYGIVENIVCMIDIPRFTSDWQSDIRNMAIAFYDLLIQHPHALPIISTHSPLTEKGLGQVEKVYGIISSINVKGIETLKITHVIIAFVIGHVEMSVMSVQTDHAMNEKLAQHMAVNTDYPLINKTAEELNNWDHKNEFLFGLDLLLRGINDLYSEEKKVKK